MHKPDDLLFIHLQLTKLRIRFQHDTVQGFAVPNTLLHRTKKGADNAASIRDRTIPMKGWEYRPRLTFGETIGEFQE